MESLVINAVVDFLLGYFWKKWNLRNILGVIALIGLIFISLEGDLYEFLKEVISGLNFPDFILFLVFFSLGEKVANREEETRQSP